MRGLRKLLSDRRGMAMELAIITMVFVFGLCTILFTLTLIVRSNDAKYTLNAQQKAVIETIGNEFAADPYRETYSADWSGYGWTLVRAVDNSGNELSGWYYKDTDEPVVSPIVLAEEETTDPPAETTDPPAETTDPPAETTDPPAEAEQIVCKQMEHELWIFSDETREKCLFYVKIRETRFGTYTLVTVSEEEVSEEEVAEEEVTQQVQITGISGATRYQILVWQFNYTGTLPEYVTTQPAVSD
ncbi:MAG: hypothetical protein ACI4U2_07160 [Christensenellaceae bacterium]